MKNLIKRILAPIVTTVAILYGVNYVNEAEYLKQQSMDQDIIIIAPSPLTTYYHKMQSDRKLILNQNLESITNR
jgi:hypothetical protein